MWFGVLGPVEARGADGEAVALGGPRVRALLAMLVLDAGRVVPAERLIDGLYGDDPPGGAANALQSQVSRLRQALKPLADRELVEFHPAGYRLAIDDDAADDAVDVRRFERLRREGRPAEALAQWRGPALADVIDAPFARSQATRLHELRLSTTEERIEAELATPGKTPPATLVAELRELIAEHPLRERLRALLMRALLAAGRQAEALAAYEEARQTLADELGADPSEELSALHLRVLRAETQATGPARRLPAQLTSFVGRSDELARIGELLRTSRLVTLTGPGGAGKTRLAIEAAARETETEVCFVELALVSDAAEIPATLAAAIGLREPMLPRLLPHAEDQTERLIAALAGRRLLLVLDNCEHLVDAIARHAARLLAGAPTLCVLATSREPLGITGESLCPVQSLGLPAETVGPAEALGYPAVRLFYDRARAVRPGFELTGANVDSVLRIVRTLDGLPLAIELAAARLRALPADDLAARLEDRFALLSRGSRTAEPRHRTLRAAVEWSWDLLDDAERRLARRLSVFAGGARLDAVERVCGLSPAETVDLLTSLTDRSLLEAGDGRYRMLETIRAFCGEQLALAGERDALRQAHAAYFLTLAETADSHLRGKDQLHWLDVLDADHDNLHAALRRSIEADPAVALRLLSALSAYWWLRGLRSEGAELAADLLRAAGPEPPAGLEEEYALCILNAAAGPYGGRDLRPQLEQANVIAQGLRSPPRQPYILMLSGMIAGPPVDDAVAAEMERGTLLVSDDAWSHALAVFGWGIARVFRGEIDEARPQIEDALARFRTIGERWGTMGALTELADLHALRQEWDRSIACSDEALRLAGELGSANDLADLLCRRATMSVRAGRLAEAEAGYEQAIELSRRAGVPESLAQARSGLGELSRLRGDLAAAWRLQEQAMRECPVGLFVADEIRLKILVAMGWTALAEGDPRRAAAYFQRTLNASRTTRSLLQAAAAADGLAGVALLESRPAEAAKLLGAATVLRSVPNLGDPDVERVTASARAQLGEQAYAAAHAEGAELARAEAYEWISNWSAFGT